MIQSKKAAPTGSFLLLLFFSGIRIGTSVDSACQNTETIPAVSIIPELYAVDALHERLLILQGLLPNHRC